MDPNACFQDAKKMKNRNNNDFGFAIIWLREGGGTISSFDTWMIMFTLRKVS